MFPLLTNDRQLTACDVLQAYRRQPGIEKRFSQFETAQRHVVTLPDGREEYLVTELTPLQREILELLEVNPDTYGR